MKRYVRTACYLALFTMHPLVAAVDQPGWSVEGLIDGTIHFEDAQTSWLSGRLGKFRVGEGDNNVLFHGAGALHYDFNLQSRLVVETALHTGEKVKIGITQAFWQYKPIARANWRSNYRVGAFHAPISFEHKDSLWQPIYTLAPSVINTWVGEELRTIGVQGRWSWRRAPISAHKFTLIAAGFGANDSAGAMLAWRGWTAHSRQTLLGESIRIPPLPVIQPGAPFHSQAPKYEPFVEVDDRIGYYAGVDWDWRRKLKVRYLYYDNRGEPLALVDGQYAWDTRFHHLGIMARPAKTWTVVVQIMHGNTLMGPGAVDNRFTSAFLLVSKKLNQHRFSARIEAFDIADRDFLLAIDPNNENGHRITLNYKYQINQNFRAALELSRLESDRDYRALFSQNERLSDKHIQLQLRYQF